MAKQQTIKFDNGLFLKLSCERERFLGNRGTTADEAQPGRPPNHYWGQELKRP